MREKFPFSCSKPNAFSDINFERVQELDACASSGGRARPKLGGGSQCGCTSWFCGSGCGFGGPWRHTCDARSCTARRSGRCSCSTATAAAEPMKLTAPVGAAVVVTVTEQLSASHNNVGDGFTGVFAQSVKASGGGVVFPRGAHVVGRWLPQRDRGSSRDPVRWGSR